MRHNQFVLTKEQESKLNNLWFVYGNRGPKSTLGNHKFIQCLLELGEYFKTPDVDEELVVEVDRILEI